MAVRVLGAGWQRWRAGEGVGGTTAALGGGETIQEIDLVGFQDYVGWLNHGRRTSGGSKIDSNRRNGRRLSRRQNNRRDKDWILVETNSG